MHTKPNRSYLFALLVSGAICVACAGCAASSDTGDISGVVKFRGEALPAGTITFINDRNGARVGIIQPDGSYSVTGMPTGSARITVIAPLPLPKRGKAASKVVPIPTKYADPAESGLSYTVVHGTQTHEVNLTE
jgi:hypothetical protein